MRKKVLAIVLVAAFALALAAPALAQTTATTTATFTVAQALGITVPESVAFGTITEGSSASQTGTVSVTDTATAINVQVTSPPTDWTLYETTTSPPADNVTLTITGQGSVITSSETIIKATAPIDITGTSATGSETVTFTLYVGTHDTAPLDTPQTMTLTWTVTG